MWIQLRIIQNVVQLEGYLLGQTWFHGKLAVVQQNNLIILQSGVCPMLGTSHESHNPNVGHITLPLFVAMGHIIVFHHF